MELIVEIGQNHNGNINLAIDMIKMAAASGADVAKFQVYDARALFPKENNPWYDYNCSTELSRQDVELLARTCASEHIEFMASVFDVERVQWLEDVGVKRYKLASRSIRDIALIKRLCATQKSLLVSLGMWTEDTFPVFPDNTCIEYLYCISEYPTPLEHIHLSQCDFTRYAGFSDHSVGLTASMAAFALGARIVEKHFTLDKTSYGPDHSGSMDLQELKQLIQFKNELELCLK